MMKAFFIPKSVTKLEPIELRPLLWENELSGVSPVTEANWLHEFVRPSFLEQFNKKIPYELGRAYSKTSGFHRLPQLHIGLNRTVIDLFGKKNSYDWEIQDGRILVFLNFYIVKEDQIKEEKIKEEKTTAITKKRTKHQKDLSQSDKSPPRTKELSQSSSLSPLPIRPIKRSKSEPLDSCTDKQSQQEQQSVLNTEERTDAEERTNAEELANTEELANREELTNIEENSPAYRTRNIRTRRPAKKSRT